MIYFVEIGAYIKIGYSSNVRNRIDILSHSYPDVKFLASIPGSKEDERDIHRYFEPHRVKYEFFDIPQEILTRFMDDLHQYFGDKYCTETKKLKPSHISSNYAKLKEPWSFLPNLLKFSHKDKALMVQVLVRNIVVNNSKEDAAKLLFSYQSEGHGSRCLRDYLDLLQ